MELEFSSKVLPESKDIQAKLRWLMSFSLNLLSSNVPFYSQEQPKCPICNSFLVKTQDNICPFCHNNVEPLLYKNVLTDLSFEIPVSLDYIPKTLFLIDGSSLSRQEGFFDVVSETFPNCIDDRFFPAAFAILTNEINFLMPNGSILTIPEMNCINQAKQSDILIPPTVFHTRIPHFFPKFFSHNFKRRKHVNIFQAISLSIPILGQHGRVIALLASSPEKDCPNFTWKKVNPMNEHIALTGQNYKTISSLADELKSHHIIVDILYLQSVLSLIDMASISKFCYNIGGRIDFIFNNQCTKTSSFYKVEMQKFLNSYYVLESHIAISQGASIGNRTLDSNTFWLSTPHSVLFDIFINDSKKLIHNLSSNHKVWLQAEEIYRKKAGVFVKRITSNCIDIVDDYRSIFFQSNESVILKSISNYLVKMYLCDSLDVINMKQLYDSAISILASIFKFFSEYCSNSSKNTDSLIFPSTLKNLPKSVLTFLKSPFIQGGISFDIRASELYQILYFSPQETFKLTCQKLVNLIDNSQIAASETNVKSDGIYSLVTPLSTWIWVGYQKKHLISSLLSKLVPANIKIVYEGEEGQNQFLDSFGEDPTSSFPSYQSFISDLVHT